MIECFECFCIFKYVEDQKVDLFCLSGFGELSFDDLGSLVLQYDFVLLIIESYCNIE